MRMNDCVAATLLAFALTTLVACTPSGRSHDSAAASPGTALAADVNQAYASPFAYCRAIGTIDQPDARYTGPNPPPALIAGLVKAFGAPAAATRSAAFTRGSHWRCMAGKVYACSVGANLPCMSKADTSREPGAGEKKYCAANHDSLYIPMYVTGHNTIYDWRCEGTKPVAGKTLSKVDARGYIADIWYLIPPAGG